jgi:two-component system KDP operon response regulator KdpE
MKTARPAIQVLVVEDEEPIRQFLVATLEAEGYEVHQASGLRTAMQVARVRRIDLYLVDLGLPDGDGVEFIRDLRTWTQRPVIVLSARSQEREKVEALDAGADDFMVKPFAVAELHARLRVALRHAAQTSMAGASVLRIGPLRIDLEAHMVHRDDVRVRLTATEWRLLGALARRVDRVVTSSQLLRDVWGPGHLEQGHYLRIYIRQLRRKLEPDPAHPVMLLTDTGVGYRLVTQADRHADHVRGTAAEAD